VNEAIITLRASLVERGNRFPEDSLANELITNQQSEICNLKSEISNCL